jgi:hypothetical protein
LSTWNGERISRDTQIAEPGRLVVALSFDVVILRSDVASSGKEARNYHGMDPPEERETTSTGEGDNMYEKGERLGIRWLTFGLQGSQQNFLGGQRFW